jgi:hypothetical protein
MEDLPLSICHFPFSIHNKIKNGRWELANSFVAAPKFGGHSPGAKLSNEPRTLLEPIWAFPRKYFLRRTLCRTLSEHRLI